jgi:hypothetical protein
MGIYESSGHANNPLGFLAFLVGVVGAASALLMWVYQYAPDNGVIDSISARLGTGELLGDRLVMTAAICGGVACGLAIISSLGGKARGSAIFALVLGVVALSFPVLSSLDVIARPLAERLP